MHLWPRITGWFIESIRPKLHFKPHYMVGNHGITGLTYSKQMLPVARKISRVWSRQLGQFDEQTAALARGSGSRIRFFR
jgi:hypothetical protein